MPGQCSRPIAPRGPGRPGGRGPAVAWLLVALLGGFAAPASGDDPIALRSALVVSLDSVRADHLALYGYPRTTTPELDRRARERGALVFTRTSAAAPSCHPSHVTLLTGLYPPAAGTPFCGEDLLPVELPEAATELEELERIQERLQSQPPALEEKRLTAVMNWLAIPEATRTLATHLQREGFRTAGFASIWTIAGKFGYARGFDRYVDDLPEYYGPPSLAWLLKRTLRSQRRQVGAATVDAALEFLGDLGPQDRFFAFLHLADAHTPYAPRELGAFAREADDADAVRSAWRVRYDESTRDDAFRRMDREDGHLLDLYDGSIRYVDAQLGRVFDALEASGRLDDTLVVVTADHGESFGQHRYLSGVQDHRLFFEHSVYLWEETQGIPLVVFDPGRRGEDGPVRVGGNASQVDVAPTVLRRLGFDPDDLRGGPLPGRDLTEPEAAEADRTVFFLTFGRGRPALLRGFFLDYPTYVGFRRGDLKFVVGKERFKNARQGRCFLYDLAEDPHEQRNLCEGRSPDDPELLEHRQVLVDWYASTRPPDDAPGAREVRDSAASGPSGTMGREEP